MAFSHSGQMKSFRDIHSEHEHNPELNLIVNVRDGREQLFVMEAIPPKRTCSHIRIHTLSKKKMSFMQTPPPPCVVLLSGHDCTQRLLTHETFFNAISKFLRGERHWLNTRKYLIHFYSFSDQTFKNLGTSIDIGCRLGSAVEDISK